MKVISVLEDTKWVVPCFHVVTLKFTKAEIEIEGNMQMVLLNGENARSKLRTLPCDIVCTSLCQIEFQNNPTLVIWEYDLWILPGLASSESEELLSSEAYTTSCRCSSDEENEVTSNEEGEEDQEHTLPFKVMGVGHTADRQRHLKEAYNLHQNNTTPLSDFKVKLEPEPDNAYDEHAISVYIDHGSVMKLVGYIAHELTKYIHPLLEKGAIKQLRIGSIRYRATYSIAEFYMRLDITRK